MVGSQLPLPQRLRLLRIIWMGFIAAVFVYGLVLGLVLQKPEHGPAPDTQMMQAALSVLALLTAGMSIWWRRRVSGETELGPSLAVAGEDPIDTLHRNSIIVWAHSESVAIYGLVLGFLARDFGIFQSFAVASLVLFYVHRPAAWSQWPSA